MIIIAVPYGGIHRNFSFGIKNMTSESYEMVCDGRSPGIYWSNGDFTSWDKAGEYIEKVRDKND